MNFFLVLAFLGLLNTAHADQILFTPDTAQEVIETYAVHHGIVAQPFLDTLKCESNLNPNATHISSKERSYGIAQINLMAHPDITKEEALNPLFAIDWAAYQFSIGNAHMWTCYKAASAP